MVRAISSREIADRHAHSIWWDRQLHRVPPALRAAIEDGSNHIFVSAATVWEIAIKQARGKLDFPAPIAEAVERLNFTLLPITGAHAEHAGRLPPHHRDPFDRMLIAQAMLEGLVLGTQDAMARPYGVPTLGLDPQPGQ
jgi:PIN domain nuclease of toxin-antitoxin system